MISYGRQFLDKKDLSSVLSVLRSGWLTQGPSIKKFEDILKKKFGSRYCCVVTNGTAALHLVGLALNWKKGDIVLGSPLSFVASTNSIIYSGATPDFVDIDKTTYNINIDLLEKKIKFYNNKNKNIAAVIATDYAGHPCDWKRLKFISKKYKFKLINDNCHAIGAQFEKNSHYAVKYADVVTHSYHPVKNITTGEGGAILTNNKIIDKKVRMLRSHGITRDKSIMSKNDGPWYYEMRELGFNYRITDFQCALGISQLTKLNKFIKKRKEIAKIYDLNFYNKNIFTTPKVNKNCSHAYHLYPLQINFKNSFQKKKMFVELLKKKFNLQVHYIPIHLQPYYKKKFGFKKGDYPVVEKFYLKEVSLPIFYSLKKKDIYKVIHLINSFCKIFL